MNRKSKQKSENFSLKRASDRLSEVYRQVQIIKSDQPSMAEQQGALNKIEELSRPA